MKRAGWIFLLAVLLPVLTLAALAMRAAWNEQAFLERQQEESARAQVALIVSDAETELAEMRQEFAAIYREVDFSSRDTAAIEQGCREFQKEHPFARLIFVLDRDGTILWTFAPQTESLDALASKPPLTGDAGAASDFDKKSDSSVPNRANETAKAEPRPSDPVASANQSESKRATGMRDQLEDRSKKSSEPHAEAQPRAPLPATPPAPSESRRLADDARRLQPLQSQPSQKKVEGAMASPQQQRNQQLGQIIQGGGRVADALQQQRQQPQDPQQQQPQQTQQQQQQQQSDDEAQKFREREQGFLWNRDTITAYMRAEQNTKQSSQLFQKSEPKAATGKDAAPNNASARSMKKAQTPPQQSAARSSTSPPVVAKESALPALPAKSRDGSELRNDATPPPAPEIPHAEMGKLATDYAQHAKPVETKLQPQLPSNPSGFNAPVVAIPASFQDFIALGQNYIPRVTDNQLGLLLYARDPDVPDRIVGCEVNLDELKSRLQQRLAARGWASDVCAAILDDKIRPVALSLENFTTDFRRPLVSELLSASLPHWEAAIYSTQPSRIASTARWVSWTVGLSVLTCLVVIFVGTILVWREAARERRLAQQKADFVTNITHELQTPLANIRLFSEMLGNGGASPDKHSQYANVLVAETERLSRLINNVLDFAKADRQRQRDYQMQAVEVGAFVRDVTEMQRPRLESLGFQLRVELPESPLAVRADREALSLALLNLISNAEKYGGERSVIEVCTQQVGNRAEISVLDRGGGVPSSETDKIFEAFYRAHDQLNSGTSGTGLGLTLSRRIALDHGGDLRHEPRDDGGSAFVLRLPLV